jgi:hypothetical protein
MRRTPVRLPALLIVLAAAAAFAAPALADGPVLYVNRVVVAGPGDVRLGDLVSAGGALDAAARETLSRSVATVADKLLSVPLSQYLPLLEEGFGRDAIIVGARSIVAPRGSALEQQAFLLDRLADWLIGQGLLGEARQEIAVTQANASGSAPRSGTPSFQVLKTVKGVSEVSFSLSSAEGSVSGRAVIASPAQGPEARPGIRSGVPVQVVFHKNLITIEMQGKAQGAAGIGEAVAVFVADSQKSFTGKLREGRVVDVELP